MYKNRSLLLGLFYFSLFSYHLMYSQQKKTLPWNLQGTLIEQLKSYNYINELDSFELDLIEIRILKKIPLNKSINLLQGGTWDIYIPKEGVPSFGILSTTGVELKPTESSYINLLYNFRINNLPKTINHYNTNSKQSFNFGAGLTF
ncbi:hypothetical protein [Mangrovimonas futianensis]|uniref:hypothetical protein n=1 Tax=Mangrovimonas futianensis TaxID=2895523 RepID=UPI001E45FC22|nr:hypothetical protein [Mangrovimonas futianensis]MCF1420964.1 hypothetical protein [Mangrovimonas futianensis]